LRGIQFFPLFSPSEKFKDFWLDLSKSLRRGAIGKDHRVFPLNPSRWNRPIGGAQARERIDFVASRHHP
jgi:hypothetical protein